MEENVLELERAIVVSVITQDIDDTMVKEYLDELEFLALTAGIQSIKRFTQRLTSPNSKSYVGSGKLEEIRTFLEENEVNTVIFDDELSPSQLRNVEREFAGRKIYDRTSLILDIFAQRAKTAYAKTQVELAQYQYLLPRLTRMWTHLERQRGGKGGLNMRGPGESQLETDRRIILDKISLLKEKLRSIDKQKVLQRKNRESLVRVALVGYTNVGKSTLMNLLSKSDVFAENKLFATLDTTVRKVVIENLPFLLTDTVGFIRKLPHGLVESFKSTLDEVREADLLIHVVDISHRDYEEQINEVNKTLQEIDAIAKPTILVFNKIDAYNYTEKEPDDLTPMTKDNFSLEMLQNHWMAKNSDHTLFISAGKKINIEQLRNLMYEEIKRIHAVRYPYNNFLY